MPGGYCLGFSSEDIVRGMIVRGILSGGYCPGDIVCGILSRGYCPGDIVLGDNNCPDTIMWMMPQKLWNDISHSICHHNGGVHAAKNLVAPGD